MPMIDYLCQSCGTRFEHFFHSNAPPSHRCLDPDCTGTALRIASLPGEYRPRNAQLFSPIVVWVSDSNPDQISIPPRADEPVEPGYHAVSITNMREADQMTKHMNNVSLRETTNRRAAEREYWDAVTRERRDSIRAKIGSNHRAQALFKATCEYIDKRRERRYSKPLDPKGHFQALSFNSSNRDGYSDTDTSWRTKKS
jgi:hypothetical protein